MLDEFEETAAIGRHTRQLVCAVIDAGGLQSGDPTEAVIVLHRDVSLLLNAVALKHGHEAVETACTYCIQAFHAKLLFQAGEIEPFITAVAADARAVTRDIAKRAQFTG